MAVNINTSRNIQSSALDESILGASRVYGGSGGYGGPGFSSLNANPTRLLQQSQLLPVALQMGYRGLSLGNTPRGTSFQQQQLDQTKSQFDAQQRNRQQLLDLIGLTPQTMGSGGLLGGTFFQSILGNTLPNVVGGITGNLPLGGGGGGSGTQGGGGSLFDQLLSARGALSQDILGDLDQFGGSQRARINQDYTNLGNSALAGLEARGLGATNLAPAVSRGVERDRQMALGSLEDQLLGQRIGAKQQAGEGLFGDVGREMDRGVERQRIGSSLLNALLGSAFNTVSL